MANHTCYRCELDGPPAQTDVPRPRTQRYASASHQRRNPEDLLTRRLLLRVRLISTSTVLPVQPAETGALVVVRVERHNP